MAAVATVDGPVADDHEDAVRHYRNRLTRRRPRFPWAGSTWEPVRIGPTWQTTADGKRWVLPDASLGWDVIAWAATTLRIAGEPFLVTDEQARWLLHWYALDEAGRFVYTSGVLQRLKGWGKDPLGVLICAAELVGPCRFAGWHRGKPVAADNPAAWVDTAAVAQEQTKNTTRLLPGLFTDEARKRYAFHPGKEISYAYGDERMLRALTSAPATLEGARSTFTLENETHHWLANNDGHAMADVIERNAVKSNDGAARFLAITNAPNPSEDSVALRDREAYELAAAGDSLTTGILYDSLEAPPDAPLTAEAAPDVVAAIRGDADWLDTDRVVASILDTRNPPSRSRRFWYNQLVAAEDAWLVPQEWDYLARPDELVADGTPVALFFDGSKTDDATGLVAARLDDGHVITVGLWQRPPGERGAGWIVPRHDVDRVVAETFDRYDVRGFFADPSHALEDETGGRFWDDLVDEWHRRYNADLEVWAQPGKGGHAVNWDMTSPKRAKDFVAAAERFAGEVEAAANLPPDEVTFTHDGDARLRRHVHNARRRPGKYGVGLGKAHRDSSRKVDLAVCAVGARMVRRLILNRQPKRRRTGRVW